MEQFRSKGGDVSQPQLRTGYPKCTSALMFLVIIHYRSQHQKFLRTLEAAVCCCTDIHMSVK